jgi:hypothetical protein
MNLGHSRVSLLTAEQFAYTRSRKKLNVVYTLKGGQYGRVVLVRNVC